MSCPFSITWEATKQRNAISTYVNVEKSVEKALFTNIHVVMLCSLIQFSLPFKCRTTGVAYHSLFSR